MNIKGMEKFIKDLNEQVSKICHFSAKLESSTSEYFKEYLRQQMLADLKNTKLKIEFTNLETDDMEVLKSKVSPNIEKVYVKEYEKEIKELENANEMKRKSSKGPNASIKNRSSKRRSNMLNSDNKSGWETESLPTQRMDELQRTYEHKIKMYIDRIKEQVIFNDLDLLSEQEKESIYLRREYSKLNDSKEEEVKEEEEEKEISKTYLKHTKHAKILERCSITSQEDLYKCLQNFFVLLHNHKTSPVFSFCLSLFDFLLDNEQNSHYLMTYPNSINFLSLFQKTTCLLSSPTSTSLPGLLFLSEIICRNPDSFLGMPSLSREVLDRLDEFNSDLVGEINVDVKARLAYTLAMVKDVQGDKVATMDMIEKWREFLGQAKAQGMEIVLPWVSFGEWITFEKLDAYSKKIEQEVHILNAEKVLNSIRQEIEGKKENNQYSDDKYDEQILSIGIFFIKNVIQIVANPTSQKD